MEKSSHSDVRGSRLLFSPHGPIGPTRGISDDEPICTLAALRGDHGVVTGAAVPPTENLPPPGASAHPRHALLKQCDILLNSYNHGSQPP